MLYANVNGIRTLPTKGLKGTCPSCGGEVIAKCGQQNVHHWAHLSKDCDSWYEPMTQWHIDWQNMFPEFYREKQFYDEVKKEYHRADIHTLSLVTIEFQNSPISIDEINSRSSFYEKLIWVINGANFKDQFEFLCEIPNPELPETKDYQIICTKPPVGKSAVLFQNLKTDEVFGPNRQEVAHLIDLMKKGKLRYWGFNWKHKREGWFLTKDPVFIDFGDGILYWLKQRNHPDDPIYYLQVVTKKEFISKYSL
jgi:hypothetical protein